MKLSQIEKQLPKEVKRLKERETDYAKKSTLMLESYITIGELLIEAKTQADHWGDWVEKYGCVKYAQANRLIRIAVHKEQARRLVSDGAPANTTVLPPLLPKTSDPIEETSANPLTLAYVGTQPGARNADDWHTPAQYIEAAREVMTSIHLDPFSSHQANSTVKANKILTLADDAFTVPWANPDISTVWMNPPYSKGASSKAVDKFLEEFDYGSFDTAIVLMNSSTDTKWFHRMVSAANAVCFTAGRISFNDAGGKASSGNTKGQVFFYFGQRTALFYETFSAFGAVLETGTV